MEKQTMATVLSYGLQNSPQKIAVNDGSTQYSYKDLETRSDHLAALLQNRYGIRKGDRVLVIADKASEIIVVMIGIWKTGAIYVPVDKEDGILRAKYISDLIEPKLFISTKRSLERFDELIKDAPSLNYDEVTNIQRLTDDAYKKVAIAGEDASVILHTSGSTGKPKGAILSHSSIIEYFKAHNEHIQFTAKSRIINYGPFHFDISLQDTFMPLYFGASVYLFRGMFISPIIINLIKEEKITHLIAIASVLSLIAGKREQIEQLKDSSLEFCQAGGEICDVKIFNAWAELMPHIRLYNAYGPVECNSICSVYRIHKPDYNRKKPFSFGKPLKGSKAILLDEDQNVITESETKGVLAIAGPQLMNGYWKKPALTAQVFYYHNDEKYYITGDLAKRDDDGNYYFEGRRDKEVKILGKRINLNEIRNSLFKIDGIDYAIVDTVQLEAERQIYAYAYVSPKNEISYDDILEHLRSNLPYYMVPKYLCVSNNIAKTSTNKVDERTISNALSNKIKEAAETFELTY
ncbi:AMP-binding protein [Kordia jejudonensis]|uniref:AMP-binding protein n=1 Tax=Kordia jejudonensis TaxID=1348245 RepID=UPI0006297ADE|nr:AMP-binding protein [Kordia jejudonensis]